MRMSILTRSSLPLIGLGLATFATFRSTSHVCCEAATHMLPPAAKKAGEKLRDLDIKIYQYEICPFCNKVKSFLDYHKIPYSAIEVNPLTKGELSFSEYKKVPVAMIGGRQVNDSSVIVDELVKIMDQQQVLMPADVAAKFQDVEVRKWMKWSDEKLAVLLFPNITRSFAESYETFSYIMDVPHFSYYTKLANRYAGALAMCMAQGKIKRKYNIDDEREALYKAIQEWLDVLGDSPFFGGKEPCGADFAVYGALHAIEGLTTHNELMKNTGIAPWYNRVKAAVGESSCISRI
eukprot:TRINITY_DN28_c0_g1::TRINITY_DN28_c0_g1_i2::g.14902::m.14902 TRINITY_DN28_c0_g1::TRINITY_DN28_c0_g1_i2::g.14902  ORF type:complete len:292 (-),score=87.52,sp/Q66LN0/PGES2_BOVIN/36.86/4e-53,GST_C_3/PF14497.1/4.9e-11,GST_N_3/PF13417.1/1.3e-10,Glutaredoxin/PF00462.19/2.1e-08,Glutaredoxin/PF00462.19/1.2e+04,GST_C_2/PF13410.1/7.1e-06,GST_N_2/PF13409.1/2.1e-05,GST_C/PF00043.20/0.0051,DUF2493/PF10686.4/0.11,Phosphorylase/PF00343.15/0.095 TRINITY_DN28_c0_g1_i2:783-1658(-)